MRNKAGVGDKKMDLIKIQVGLQEFKIDPRRVIATGIDAGREPYHTTYYLLSIFLDGGHKIIIQQDESRQQCLDIEQGIWKKVGGIQDNEELPISMTLDEHARYRITTGAGS